MDMQAQFRQHTRTSFLISLLLHLIAITVTNIRLPHWYRPPPVPESITMAPIEILYIQRFYASHRRKHLVAPVSQNPASPKNHARVELQKPIDRMEKIERPLPLRTKMLAIDANLATSDSLFWNHPTAEALLEMSIMPTVHTSIESPKTREFDIKRGFSQKQELHEPIPDEKPPLTREEQIGDALEAIAKNIANGSTSLLVDIALLLDASGSMEDNIRAVGKQLSRMVETFQQKQLDFTLGVITFKYLDRDTIVFPQTQDYEKYQNLLESHVIQRGGDERAYDAILKSIKRVRFRSSAERRFILITDEPTKGSHAVTEVIRQCRTSAIKLDVIGVNVSLDKALAIKTGGLWLPIPGGR